MYQKMKGRKRRAESDEKFKKTYDGPGTLSNKGAEREDDPAAIDNRS